MIIVTNEKYLPFWREKLKELAEELPIDLYNGVPVYREKNLPSVVTKNDL